MLLIGKPAGKRTASPSRAFNRDPLLGAICTAVDGEVDGRIRHLLRSGVRAFFYYRTRRDAFVGVCHDGSKHKQGRFRLSANKIGLPPCRSTHVLLHRSAWPRVIWLDIQPFQARSLEYVLGRRQCGGTHGAPRLQCQPASIGFTESVRRPRTTTTAVPKQRIGTPVRSALLCPSDHRLSSRKCP
jgi:hypothetical protein